MSQKKVVGRNVAIVLGIACIVFIASMGGTMAYYTMQMNQKNQEYDSYVADHTHANSEFNTLNSTYQDYVQTHSHTNSEYSSQYSTLQSQIQTLGNQKTLLQTWLDGNKTLLQTTTAQRDQLQTWLNGNITNYQSQVDSLSAQISSLATQVANLQDQITSLNNQIATLQSQIDDLNQIVNQGKSTVWVDSETVSQPKGSYSVWTFDVPYAGRIVVNVESSTTSNTYAEVIDYGNDAGADISVVIGTSGSRYFPVFPYYSVEVRVGNTNWLNGATETVTITYWY